MVAVCDVVLEAVLPPFATNRLSSGMPVDEKLYGRYAGLLFTEGNHAYFYKTGRVSILVAPIASATYCFVRCHLLGAGLLVDL